MVWFPSLFLLRPGSCVRLGLIRGRHYQGYNFQIEQRAFDVRFKIFLTSCQIIRPLYNPYIPIENDGYPDSSVTIGKIPVDPDMIIEKNIT
jgi:hypothetical protein